MDRFLVRKRAGAAVESKEPSPKKLCNGSRAVLLDPAKVISWNVNGLAVQLRNNWSLIKDFLEREQPDVLCLQEVRLPAQGPKGCKRNDGQKRRRSEVRCDTAQEKAEWELVQKTLVSACAADYKFHWSLADWKYSGTLLLIRRHLDTDEPDFTCPPLAKYPNHKDPADPRWHPEGRVIRVRFASFDLLATYSPNNGNDPDAFARRSAWDDAMKEFVAQRERPLIWIGDLNVAAQLVDVSHPDWFLQQCYQGEPANMRGQPGFTEGERRRFQEILAAGQLVDAYRHLTPAEDVPPAHGPHFTWRGHPPVHQAVAKYHGKGMRIDYALISQELLPRLGSCDILGSGAERCGFLGSDHCPIRLCLKPASASGASGLPGLSEAKNQVTVVDLD
ncbi:unnamed protein product [Effrenium voratum]|uniref:DNA-(apurinic or apyrimidinic site) endonuclease n=1 Tax=Effrenium voratum TaxID=2562239 RepID=A0AA36JTV6_9DINO|nr:unnamed protein product [Effrenium voratum]CAJ1456782.1 unnamed protein product [Effrenium voratum]